MLTRPSITNQRLMEVIIKVPTGTDVEKINRFFSMFRFTNLSIGKRSEIEARAAAQTSEATPYFVNVVPGLDGLVESDFERYLESGSCSLLFFNDQVAEDSEPKVIYTTDHSPRAYRNLERFKELKPAGFSGATVISEGDALNSKISLNDMSRQILEKIKSTVQSTQANLIIASYDFGNTGRKKAQIANVVKMVRQNKCHVLILKTY